MNTSIRTKLTTVLFCTFASGALLPLSVTLAVAAEDSLPTRTVSYADLDVSKPAGAQTLYRRIKAAAKDVCQTGMVTDRHLLGVDKGCVKQAIDNAVKDVNSPALTDVHAGKTLLLSSR